MWEKDKQVLAMYRECVATMLESMRAGEEIDYETTCVVESEKLAGYTMAQVGTWQRQHPSQLSEKKQSYFTPKQPYFQNL